MDRQGFLDAGKRKPKVVEVPHPLVTDYYGGAVFIRVMSGTDLDSFESGKFRQAGTDLKFDPTNVRARLIVRCVCDAEGKRILTDQDAAAVGQHDGAVLDILFDECQELNGLTTKAEEAVRGNSSNGQTAASGTVSPAISE